MINTVFKTTQPMLPGGITHPPQASFDHLKAFGDLKERGGGDHQYQALQTKKSALVVQKAFVNRPAANGGRSAGGMTALKDQQAHWNPTVAARRASMSSSKT